MSLPPPAPMRGESTTRASLTASTAGRDVLSSSQRFRSTGTDSDCIIDTVAATGSGSGSAAAADVEKALEAATDTEARQKRIEALLASRGVPLVGPVKYSQPAAVRDAE